MRRARPDSDVCRCRNSTGYGWHVLKGTITSSYSSAFVSGTDDVGGLVGGRPGSISSSFRDVQSSGRTARTGGTGKTTAKMQMAKTFLDAGWDFGDETANSTEDIWWIDKGKDSPRVVGADC